jgi:hypothetical protein
VLGLAGTAASLARPALDVTEWKPKMDAETIAAAAIKLVRLNDTRNALTRRRNALICEAVEPDEYSPERCFIKTDDSSEWCKHCQRRDRIHKMLVDCRRRRKLAWERFCRLARKAQTNDSA